MFFLPFDSQIPEDDAALQEICKTTGGTERILVVDDDLDIQNFIQKALERSGYAITLANNGMEALEILETATTPFDLLITDIMMPTMNGKELVKAIQRRIPNIRVIYISGYSEIVFSDLGVNNSSIFFIQKPFEVDFLLKGVRRALL